MVWEHFGNVSNYVEPFFGSGAVLLGRPTAPKTETVNDADCYLSNFWRALRADPDSVAYHADWPVNEADLLARHKWLIAQEEFRAKIKTDPVFYDSRIAGWWVWGLCAWIGSGWCRAEANQIPHLGDAGQGINRKLPHLGDAGQGIQEYFALLADRLRKVRVCCGDWSRVMGESVTLKHGTTGVFLDPPYSSNRCATYSVDDFNVANDVREWAIENGNNPLLKIALCGYEGEHEMSGWEKVAWKAAGGFASQGNGTGRENCHKERIWFSPSCELAQGRLF